eukprot:scaffold45719_cov26-Tisochrysis_lutea.AAC.5
MASRFGSAKNDGRQWEPQSCSRRALNVDDCHCYVFSAIEELIERCSMQTGGRRTAKSVSRSLALMPQLSSLYSVVIERANAPLLSSAPPPPLEC